VSIIDRQRIAAVRAMEVLGYTFDGIAWAAPASDSETVSSPVIVEADKMHALLVMRSDALAGCIEGSLEKMELKTIAETVEAYEAKRWADGAAPGGKR
jgi:hypothetical protein